MPTGAENLIEAIKKETWHKKRMKSKCSKQPGRKRKLRLFTKVS